MNITLWIPSAEPPRWPVYESVWNLRTPDNIKMRLVPGKPNNVRFSWNKVVKDFLDTTDDYLMSWHSDVTGSPETLMRLLSWEKPLVSALIFMRQSPVVPHIWRQYDNSDGRYAQRIKDTRDWFYRHPEYMSNFGPFVMDEKEPDALAEVDFTSTSCTLIHRSVLEAMRPNVNDLWFLWDDDYAGGGEDRRFFEEARKVGFVGYVDRSCVVGHLMGDVPSSVADFIAWDSVSEFNGTGEP